MSSDLKKFQILNHGRVNIEEVQRRLPNTAVSLLCCIVCNKNGEARTIYSSFVNIVISAG